MSLKQVTFDLDTTIRGNQYQTQRHRIHSVIRRIDYHAFQPCKQIWIINTEMGVAEIRDAIIPFLNSNYGEKLLVTEIASAAWRVDLENSQRLKDAF